MAAHRAAACHQNGAVLPRGLVRRLLPTALLGSLVVGAGVGCSAEEPDPDLSAQVCRQAALGEASLDGVRQAVRNGAGLPTIAASSYAGAIERLIEVAAGPGELDATVEERLVELIGGYSRTLTELTTPASVDLPGQALLDELSPLLGAEERLAGELAQACAG